MTDDVTTDVEKEEGIGEPAADPVVYVHGTVTVCVTPTTVVGRLVAGGVRVTVLGWFVMRPGF